jgi:hypothetical protein
MLDRWNFLMRRVFRLQVEHAPDTGWSRSRVTNMAMKDLPRPWLLAALADVPITELAQLGADQPCEDEEEERQLPRADQRRQRLASWRRPRHLCADPGMEGERPG